MLRAAKRWPCSLGGCSDFSSGPGNLGVDWMLLCWGSWRRLAFLGFPQSFRGGNCSKTIHGLQLSQNDVGCCTEDRDALERSHGLLGIPDRAAMHTSREGAPAEADSYEQSTSKCSDSAS